MPSSSTSRRSLVVAAGVLLLAGGVWGLVQLGGERGAAPRRLPSSLPADTTARPESLAPSSQVEETAGPAESRPAAEVPITAASAQPAPVVTAPTPQPAPVVIRPQMGADGVIKLGAHSKRDPKLRLQGGHPRLQGKTHSKRPVEKRSSPRGKGRTRRTGHNGGRN